MTAARLPIKTDRLSLRLHREDDGPALLAMYSQPDVARYLLDDPWTESIVRDKVADRMRKNGLDGESGALALVIELESNVIGDLMLWYTDRRRRVAEIGWLLDPESSGQGFAAEAARALLDFAFEYHRVHRVSAQLDARNDASARLAERLGMQREAHLRQDWWSKGEWTDTLIYAMLASDR